MKLSKLKALVSSLALAAVSLPAPQASAAGSITNTVTEIYINTSSTVFVRFGGNISGRPACATTANEMAFMATDAAGQRLLEMFRAAQLSGKRVTVQGSNACTTNSTRENVSNVRILAT